MPNAGNNSTHDVIQLLKDLNEKMGLMVDVMEKRPRSETPGSMYFRRSSARHLNITRTDVTPFDNLSNRELSERYSASTTEFENANPQFKADIEEQKRIISNQKEILNNASAYTSVQLDNARNEISVAKQKIHDIMDVYRDELKNFTKQKHNENAKEINENLKKLGYKNYDAYERQEKVDRAKDERSESRRMAVDEIAYSGLGDTAIGRGAQKILGAREKGDTMVRFGHRLKNGYADNLSEELFGKNIFSKGASKAISGFGSALAKLGGPLAGLQMGFQMGWAAVEKFAEVVNKANAYINRNIKAQTNLDKLKFEQETNLATLRNEMDVETIKYIGDIQLKEMEMQAENLKATVAIMTKQMVAATEIAVGPLMGGINETAYNAAEKQLDLQGDILKAQVEIGAREQKLGLFKERRGTEYQNKAKLNVAEQNLAQTKYETDAYSTAMRNQIEQYYDLSGAFWSGNLKTDSGSDMADAAVSGASKLAYGGLNLLSGGGLKEQKALTDKLSDGKDLPTGGRSESQSEVIGRNRDKADLLNQVYSNRLWNIGKDVMESIVEQSIQPEMFKSEWAKTTQQMASNMENTIAGIQENVGNIQVDTAKEVATVQIDAALDIRKTFLKLAKETENWFDEFDNLSNNLGISFGYTSKEMLKDYQHGLLTTLENTVSKFGKDREDMVKMQQSYIEETGRQKVFSESDYGQLFGLGKYLGDDGLAAQFASQMEIFNVGASESVNLLDETLQSVNRIGLNGRKYVKDIVNNLKLAQKYSFKNGTKGMMEMAKWAQKTRFNMQSLSGMIDKIQEGGLEGVIQQSAGFQVLGGMAAINSDPLGMLYDAWSDPESLAKRYQGMTKGMGTLNRETGETTFNGSENMMIAQIAKLQGRSVEEVKGEIIERNKRDTISNKMSPEQRRQFSDEEMDFIGSSAQYNRETGQFEVNVKQGNGTYKPVSVNELSQEDLKNLMPEKHEERMEVYMQDVLTALQGVKGEEIAERANAAAATMETIIGEYAERTRVAHESYAQNRDKYIAEIINGSKLATISFKDFIGVFEQGDKDIQDAESKIQANGQKISDALSGIAEIINAAKQKIAEGINEKSVTGVDYKFNDYKDKYNAKRDTKSAKKRGEEWKRIANDFSGIEDGVVDAGDESSMIEAKHIVPINDGSLDYAKPDKSDIGMVFAKQGGPFDTLFNGIFDEIHITSNKIDTLLYGFEKFTQTYVKGLSIAGTTEIHHERRVEADTDYLAKLYDAWSDPQEYAKRTETISRNENNDNSNIPSKKDVNVNINGRLMLDSGNQSVDLMTLINTNPELVRKITEAVILQMSSNANGGKYEMFGGNRYYV